MTTADDHRCTVQVSNGSWWAECQDCPGAVEHTGTGELGKQEAERIADEHYHSYHCADPDHDCVHQRQRRKKDAQDRQFREVMALLQAARRAP